MLPDVFILLLLLVSTALGQTREEIDATIAQLETSGIECTVGGGSAACPEICSFLDTGQISGTRTFHDGTTGPAGTYCAESYASSDRTEESRWNKVFCFGEDGEDSEPSSACCYSEYHPAYSLALVLPEA